MRPTDEHVGHQRGYQGRTEGRIAEGDVQIVILDLDF